MRFQSLIVLPIAMLLSACALSPRDGKPSGNAAPVVVATTTATYAAVTAPAVEVPVQAQQQFDQALSLLKAGKTEPATQQLQQLATTYPTFAGPVINLGLIELKADRYQSAASLFQRALERDPKSVAANNYLGVSYRYMGRFKDAEVAYQAAIAADDSYAAAHLNLGVLYDLYLQKPELALPEYQRYQSLLSAPDTKVAGWIKEISGRLNAEKKAKFTAGANP